MTQPTPTAAPPALLNITLGVMLALMLGWFFHIASGVLVPMVLGLMISYVGRWVDGHGVTACTPRRGAGSFDHIDALSFQIPDEAGSALAGRRVEPLAGRCCRSPTREVSPPFPGGFRPRVRPRRCRVR